MYLIFMGKSIYRVHKELSQVYAKAHVGVVLEEMFD